MYFNNIIIRIHWPTNIFNIISRVLSGAKLFGEGGGGCRGGRARLIKIFRSINEHSVVFFLGGGEGGGRGKGWGNTFQQNTIRNSQTCSTVPWLYCLVTVAYYKFIIMLAV